MAVNVQPCADAHDIGWLALRLLLWPASRAEEHQDEMAELCASPDRFAQFIARDCNGIAVGFVEVALRSDYVSGTETSPVGFLEGILVRPEFRRRGVARTLVATAEQWASSVGCSEFASDAAIENAASHSLHAALGFVETERVVFFRKSLTHRNT